MERARDFHEARNQRLLDEAAKAGIKNVDLTFTRYELHQFMEAYATERVREELETAADSLDRMAEAFMAAGEPGYAGITRGNAADIRKRLAELDAAAVSEEPRG